MDLSKAIDLAIAGAMALSSLAQSVESMNRIIKRAHAENRDLTEDEVRQFSELRHASVEEFLNAAGV